MNLDNLRSVAELLGEKITDDELKGMIISANILT